VRLLGREPRWREHARPRRLLGEVLPGRPPGRATRGRCWA
jgi:hypothetical protein